MTASGARSITVPTVAYDGPGVRVSARRTHPYVAMLALRPSARVLRFETDDADLNDYVRVAYGNTIVSDATPATDRATLFTDAGGYRAAFNGVPFEGRWSGPGPNPWKSRVYVCDQFVWRTIADDPAWYALYACAVQLNGHTVVLAGPSGVGKTTLGLSLVQQGASLIGDEMILIRRADCQVDSVDRAFSIRGRAERFIQDTAVVKRIRLNAVQIGVQAADGFRALERSALNVLPQPAKLAATVIVSRDGGAPLLAPARVTPTALALATRAGARAQNLDDLASVAAIVGSGRCYTFNLGEPNASARRLLEASSTW